MKFSQERKVRSLAKKTLGSTRVGSAMRLPGGLVWVLLGSLGCWRVVGGHTWGGLEEGLRRHG